MSREKVIAFLVLMIILLLMLCGCDTMSKIDDKSENKIERTRFVKIESYYYGSIVVDSETNVEYWISEGTYNGGTLTMLVDGTGNPKVRN